MNRPIPRAGYEKLLQLAAEKRRRIAKAKHCVRGYRDADGIWQGGLLEFVRYFWPILEPGTKFVDGWALEAICEHLEAVTFGEVTKLLINVPPGFMKSLLTDVFWPAWEWGPMKMPHVRYVAFSYSSTLTHRDNEKFHVLCDSAEYRAIYGDVVRLKKKGEVKVSNTKHGWKLATSVGGVGTGERGDRIILDDPHNVKESESEVVRKETVRWFRESMSSRLNDMENGAKICIMQRVHEGDVSGEIIELGDWCHLLIPMEYVWQADPKTGEPYTTDIGWTDPRWMPNPEECDGALAWEERFPERIIPTMKKDAGTHAWFGQYQQTPKVRGGAIFEEGQWQDWDPPDGKFPRLSYVVASLDGAYTEDEENDPSALVIGGIFQNEQGNNRAIIMHGWRKRLKFSGPKVIPEPGESTQMLKARTQQSWGLVEWVADTCTRFNVDRLLIEAKATGITAAQVLGNSHPNAGWAIQMVDPKGDKVARALAVQPAWSQEMVFIPTSRQWATDVIDEMSVFPKGKHDDYTDATTQLIKHFRDIGLLRNDEEVRVAKVKEVEHEQARHKRAKTRLYPGSRRAA